MLVIVYCIATIIAVIIFANELYRKTNHYYNNYVFEKKYFDVKNYSQISNIVTGTSNALAAVSSFQNTGEYLVLARREQGLKTDLFLLEHCMEKMKKKTNVLLFFSPCVLLFNKSVKKNLERNLKSISPDIVAPYVCTRMNRRFPVIFNIRLIKYILFDKKKRTDFYLQKTETMSTEQAELKARLLSDAWKKQFNIKDFTMEEIRKSRQSVIDENRECLMSIIQLCKENGLRPMFVSSPFSQKLLDVLGEDFLSFFSEIIYKLCAEENIPYLNYIEDEDFIQSYSLFADGCFVLNKRGSCIFMRKLIKQIGRYDNEMDKKNI